MNQLSLGMLLLSYEPLSNMKGYGEVKISIENQQDESSNPISQKEVTTI